MPSETVRELAREEPEAFANVIGYCPDGQLKQVLEQTYQDEVGEVPADG